MNLRKQDLKQEAERLGIIVRDMLEKAMSEEFEKRRREEFRNAQKTYSNA